MLTSILEGLLALPGGHLSGAGANAFMYGQANIFMVGGPSMLKNTFPALDGLQVDMQCAR